MINKQPLTVDLTNENITDTQSLYQAQPAYLLVKDRSMKDKKPENSEFPTKTNIIRPLRPKTPPPSTRQQELPTPVCFQP